MKKTYQKPELSVFSTGFQLMQEMTIAGSNTSSNNIKSGDAKDRGYDEDEEASNQVGSTYGDLW